MPSKPSKRFDPARRERGIDILSWSTEEKPGTEFEWKPSMRESSYPMNPHPFAFRILKKPTPENQKSNDIITFRGCMRRVPGTDKVGRSSTRFLTGEINYDSPLKKMGANRGRPESRVTNDLITFTTPEKVDNLNEINYQTNYRKADHLEFHGLRDSITWKPKDRRCGTWDGDAYNTKNQFLKGSSGHQIGALMGSQRHMKVMEKRYVEEDKSMQQIKAFGKILQNTETRFEGEKYRSLPAPYQTYYDIQKRPTIGDTNPGDRFRTTF